MKNIDQSAKLFGQNIFSGRADQLLKRLTGHLQHSRGAAYIFTPNPEQLVLSRKEPPFAQALQSADILIPDGIGLVWASQVLNRFGKTEVIKERIAGTDVVARLLQLAHERTLSVVVIGGRGYESWVEREEVVPGTGQSPQSISFIRINEVEAAWLPAYVESTAPTEAEERAVSVALRHLRPQLVFVALGAPQQEYWALAHRQLLSESGASLVMVVGGAVDFLVGRVSRAPQFVQRLGFEWLYRLVREPWRWRRQVRLVEFMGMVVREALR